MGRLTNTGIRLVLSRTFFHGRRWVSSELAPKKSTAIYSIPHLIHRPDTEWPELPVLNELSEMVSDSVKPVISDTAVIAVQHMLQTTGSLLDLIKKIGIPIFYVTGKPYSNNQDVIAGLLKSDIDYFPNSRQTAPGFFSNGFANDITGMWNSFIERLEREGKIKNIIVLDEGGYLHSQIPERLLNKYNIVGIEQTMNGLMKPEMLALPFPIIGVASSAAKRYLESPLIANAIVDKLAKFLPVVVETKQSCGVVGLGHMGQAITRRLLSLGHRVMVFEKDLNKVIDGNVVRLNTLPGLIANARYIFGCTGQDITPDFVEVFSTTSFDKDLISCSSADVEFLSLIRFIQNERKLFQRHDPLSDISYKNKMDGNITIRRGGFPINFDASGISVPNNKIQLTRGLLLLAFFQALQYVKSGYHASGKHMLDPVGQALVASIWKNLQTESIEKDLLDKFDNIAWIVEHSDGISTTNNLFHHPSLRPRFTTS